MKNKIHNFDSFVRSNYTVNENIFSNFMTKAKNFVSKIKEMISKGIIGMIPSGPKQGTPIVTIFDPSDGNIYDQINAMYAGTEFAKMNPVTPNQLKTPRKITEAIVGTESPYPEGARDADVFEIKEKIKEYYKSLVLKDGNRRNANQPVFIYGAPGIGKTQIVGAAAQELDIKLLNLDLQFMAPEDFKGIPSVVELDDKEIESIKGMGPEGGMTRDDWEQKINSLDKYGAGVTVSNPPLILPRDNMSNGKGGILFMDEANRASKSVLDSLMVFVQSGIIGEDYMLPSRWIIVGAGNRRAEAPTVTGFDFAFSDRFDIVNFHPDPQDWVNYTKKLRKFGGKHGQDMYSKWPLEIINYIHKNTEWFHRLDPDKLEDEAQGMGGKFPTPRSWTTALNQIRNECLMNGVNSWRELPINDVLTIIQDNVGREVIGGIPGSQLGGIGNYLKGLYRIKPKQISLMYNQPENSSAKIQADKKELETILYGLFLMMIDQAEEEHGVPVEGEDKIEIPGEIKENMKKYFNLYKGSDAGVNSAVKEILDKIKEL